MAEKTAAAGASWFQRYSDFMHADTKGVEIVSYTVSGILFIVAYRKIRPFTRFGQASDIPKHFVREQIPQYGKVTKIEPSLQHGPLLVVRHRPPGNIIFWSKKVIPIKVNGIEINANGYSWLQSVVAGKDICFVPMVASSTQAHAECRVFLNDSKKNINVGEALLSLGFAKLTVAVPAPLGNRKDVHKVHLYQYYRSLAQAERFAKDRRNGLWQQALPPRSWLLSLWTLTWDRLLSLSRLPALVR
uniref:TNase-like domain-containing protein n=1 Tax=Anopheles atroparvus TaxID=41427 RepID=A0AAG5CRE4_ANOAO